MGVSNNKQAWESRLGDEAKLMDDTKLMDDPKFPESWDADIADEDMLLDEDCTERRLWCRPRTLASPMQPSAAPSGVPLLEASRRAIVKRSSIARPQITLCCQVCTT